MKKITLIFLLLFNVVNANAQYSGINKLLYGVAYYDEYMPYERLDKDIAMMKDAGINVVRIAESTWATLEPEDGVFNFSHVDKVLDAMYKASIKVIIGTPTYAIPSWVALKYPDVLAMTAQGQNKYGGKAKHGYYKYAFSLLCRKSYQEIDGAYKRSSGNNRLPGR